MDRIEVIPNLNTTNSLSTTKVSIAEFAGSDSTVWFYDGDYALRKVNELRRKLLSELEEPSTIDQLVTSRRQLLDDLKEVNVASLRDNMMDRIADHSLQFSGVPQPSFNKNFEVLASDLISMEQRGL